MVFCGCLDACLRVYFCGGGAAAQADVSTPVAAAGPNRHDDDCLREPLMEGVWQSDARGGWEGGHPATQGGRGEPAPLEVVAGQMNELSSTQMAQEDNIAALNQDRPSDPIFSEATDVEMEEGSGAIGDQEEEDTADLQHEDENSSSATGGTQAAAGDVDGGGDPPGAGHTCAARGGDASPNSILGVSNATTPSHSRTVSGSESESAAADGEASGGGTAEQQFAEPQKRGLLGSLLLRGEPSGQRQQTQRFAEQRLAPQQELSSVKQQEEFFDQELMLMELWGSQHQWSTPQWRRCFLNHFRQWFEHMRELSRQDRQQWAELQQDMQTARVWLQRQSQDSNYLGALMLMRG